MAELLDELARGRAALLEEIEQPPLARIRARGVALRRRRRLTAAGAALAVVAVALAATRPWSPQPPPERPAQTPPPVTVYTGGGVSLSGLELPVARIPDLPGVVTDAEFVDPDHGFVITDCFCRDGFARTADGGRSWTRNDLPERGITELVAFDRQHLLLPGPAADYASADGGASWHRVSRGTTPQPTMTPGDMLRVVQDPNQVDKTWVRVWGPDGLRGPLVTQPSAIQVTWVAPGPTATGAWWVGGRAPDGGPAVSVTTNRGQKWTTTKLPGGAGAVTVEISTLGSHAYATMLGVDRQILGIFHSANGGKTFTRTGPTGAAPRPTGELVPLLDGRLLTTSGDHHWWVSADDGRTFTRLGGDLPSVGALRRTPAGYVAYQLFSGDAGWLAASADGTAWRKLQVH